MSNRYDAVIIGAGIYGLYAALVLVRKGLSVLLIEMDKKSCTRATLINQARVHNGYHYPRSLSTAIQAAKYYDKFTQDFSFAINNRFTQIYSISRELSYTSADQFKYFCRNAHIPCKEIDSKIFLNPDTIESSFETNECSFDAVKIKDYLINALTSDSNCTIKYSTYVKSVYKSSSQFELELNDHTTIDTTLVVNATYASLNQINKLFGKDTLDLKYEICEIILCDVSKHLKNIGITIMDGPFFSLMPFGLTGHHSLTSVTFTPHKEVRAVLPTFNCQNSKVACNPEKLQNCNNCPNRPKTAWAYMHQLTQKYILQAEIKYLKSYFAIKPILITSEADDSRPTIVRELSKHPRFISILSGKINTIYDLDVEL